MKSIFLYLLLAAFCFLFLVSCRNKQTAQTAVIPDTKTEWNKKTWNFGDIASGEVVSHTFYFKNTGEHNFIIKNTESGCSCTTTTYDKAPIQPGQEGKIEIAFNSAGRYGKQYKEISIFANVPEKQITLSFTANVKE